MKFLSFKKNLILFGILMLSLSSQIVFAQNGTTLSGGKDISSAGTFDKDNLGKELTLSDHLRREDNMFVELPVLKPGQGFHVEVVNAGKSVRFNDDGTTVDGTQYAYGQVAVVNEDDTKIYCEIRNINDEKKSICRVASFSSDEESYQLFLRITGNGLNPNEGTHKDTKINIEIFEQYDEAMEGKDDVPNKVKNALAIEPGEYSGWLSGNDVEDFYKVEGLASGATLKLTISPEADEEVVLTGAAAWQTNRLIVKMYDEKRQQVRFEGNDTVNIDEIGEQELKITFDDGEENGLQKKTTRYIQLLEDCLGPCLYGVALHYDLSVEVKGNRVSQGDSGNSTNCSGFVDVARGDNRCSAVEYVRAKEIMRGTGDGTRFEGTKVLNRAEFAAVMLKFMGEQGVGNDDLGGLSQFKDISDADRGKWFVGIIRRAMALGLLNGFPDKTMRPADPVNRAQFVVIFVKAARVTLPEVTSSPAKDVSAKSEATIWYRAPVKYMIDNGLMDVDAAGNFYPNNHITRFEVADVIYRWYQKNGE